jgi:hypothetical protein
LRVPDYYELVRPKAELTRLVRERLSEIDPEKAYELVWQAFDRATVRLLVSRTKESGPNIEERKKLSEYILQLSDKLLAALTSQPREYEQEPGTAMFPPDGNSIDHLVGEDYHRNALLHAWLVSLGAYRGPYTGQGKIRKPRLGAVQHSIFSYIGQAQIATDAVAILVLLRSAAAQVLLAPIEHNGTKSSSRKRGRPTDDAMNILFSELMRCWVILTGKSPELTVNYLGEATCPFCAFFQRYLGGYDKRLGARAIADRCRGLSPAKDNPFSPSATV